MHEVKYIFEIVFLIKNHNIGGKKLKNQKKLVIPNALKDHNLFYLIIIAIFVVIFLVNSMYPYFGLAASILVIGIITTLFKHKYTKDDLNEYIIDFVNSIENLSVSSLFNSPMPVTLIDKDGNVCWYNLRFREITEKPEVVKNINEIVKNIDFLDMESNIQGVISDVESLEGDRNFTLFYSKLDEAQFPNEASFVLYWTDNTLYRQLEKKSHNEKPVAMIIQIDNYTEISESMDKVLKASILAEMEAILYKSAVEMNGFLLRYTTDKFLMIFENEFLESLEAKKFSILEEIKEISNSGELIFTLSLGIGADTENLGQLFDYAKGSVDIALARGGDQAVVKKVDSVKFYGGKSRAFEKRTKVKARMISLALMQIIEQSSNVIIMGHRVGDMDSFGSSIGLYSIAKSKGKNAYIVLNTVNYALKNIHERMQGEDPEYLEALVTTEQALKLIDSETLCVVLDTHKASFTEGPEILDVVEKTVLIDHHRRGEEYIENALLDYIEPYASSTCELVSEIVQYMDDKIKLTKFEADAMLSGIVVDTNSFIFKTGVRTFEAASFLRRNGADTINVKELFSENLDVMKRKTEIIDRAEMKFDDIAISYIDEISPDNGVIAAKTADDMLTIRKVRASFVLVRMEGFINVSARSMGQINVQMIAEILGGGGHLTMAGAQIKTDSIDEAKEKLYDAIKQFKEGGEEQ